MQDWDQPPNLPWQEWQKALTPHPGPVTSRARPLQGVEPGHSHGNIGSTSPGKGSGRG